MSRFWSAGFVFLLTVGFCRAGSRLRGARGPQQIQDSDLVDRSGPLARSSTTVVVIGNETLDAVKALAESCYQALETRWQGISEAVPSVAYLALPSGSAPKVPDDYEPEGVVNWKGLDYPNVALFYGNNLARWFKLPNNDVRGPSTKTIRQRLALKRLHQAAGGAAAPGCTADPVTPEITTESVAAWVARRSLATDISDASTLKEFQAKSGVAVVGFGLDRATRDAFQIVIKLAPNRAASQMHFARADKSLAPHGHGDSQVILWNNLHSPPRQVEFKNWATDSLAYALLNFLLDNADPPILAARTCNEEKWNRGSLHNEDGTSIATERHSLFLYFPPLNGPSPEAMKSLIAAMPTIGSQHQIVWVDWTDTQFSKELRDLYMVVDTDALPALRMQVVPRTPHGLYGHKPAALKYKCDSEYVASDPGKAVSECLTAHKAGKLQAQLKSEAELESYGDPVKSIVGSTFDKVVLVPGQDAMVLFCAPWCGHCKRFEPTFTELAKKVRAERPWVTFAKMDVTRNENRVFDFWKSPQLHLFPANSKEEPLYYDMHSDLSIPTIEKFVLGATLEAAPKDWKPDEEPFSDDDGLADL